MHVSSFPVTRWTLVVAASQEGGRAAEQALAELCSAYWYPLYAFVRRMGYSPDVAQDLTQEFFTRFLERKFFAEADPEKGRFRSFLLASIKHFVHDQWDRRMAQKRGGSSPAIALDVEDAERRYARQYSGGPTVERQLIDRDTPDTVFEREWALTLIGRVTSEVGRALEREGRADHFEKLKMFLPGQEGGESYAEAAQALGLSEGALKVAVHRLRRRFRDVFHAEIAHLVSDPAQIEGEVRYLLAALRS